MTVTEVQEKIDSVVQGTGLRLTRLGKTILYARMFAVAEKDGGYVVVALPIDRTFGDSWSGIVTMPKKKDAGLSFEQVGGEGEVVIYPLGSVKKELIEDAQKSTGDAHEAMLIARTQWGVGEDTGS